MIKSRYISPKDWEKHPANRLNNPKMTEDEAQRIADEAIAGGQKWDVQEKINARRRAERATQCGGGLGKIQAPAKFDAAVPNPRCQAGEGAYGTYFVHSSEKYGVKVFRDGPYDDVKSEFRRLDKADYAGVNVPEPKRIGKVKDQNGDIRAQTLVMSHMKGYAPIDDAYHNPYGTAANAPLIVAVKAAREFRKLHTAGLAHGDIHSGNVMADTRSKRVALVDFGYATELHDGRQRNHGRNGVENLMYDMNRLPEFLGFHNRGEDFIKRYKGTLENVEKQAKELARYGSPDIKERFTIAVKRYHDALESELLWNDRKPRSRFISGADQPRIPGLTRRLLTAKFPNTLEREVLENLHGQNLSMFEKGAKNLGVKPARLFLALKPERDARLRAQGRRLHQARRVGQRRKPFGTAIPRPPTTRRVQRPPSDVVALSDLLPFIEWED